MEMWLTIEYELAPLVLKSSEDRNGDLLMETLASHCRPSITALILRWWKAQG
jgi:hypothetical protein